MAPLEYMTLRIGVFSSELVGLRGSLDWTPTGNNELDTRKNLPVRSST